MPITMDRELKQQGPRTQGTIGSDRGQARTDSAAVPGRRRGWAGAQVTVKMGVNRV